MTDDCYEHPALTALIAERAEKRAWRENAEPITAGIQAPSLKDERGKTRYVINSCMNLLRQELKAKGFMIVPTDPSSEMINASMATATRYVGHMPKREKHRLRLQAALTAEALKAGVVE